LARTAAEIETVAETIRAEGGTARPYVVDLIQLDAVNNTIAAVERELGPVSLLTNNAGVFRAIGRSGRSMPRIGGTTSRPTYVGPSTVAGRCCRE